MSDALIPPLALHGWYMLTQFVDVPPPLDAHDEERTGRLDDLGRLLGGWCDLGDDGWSGVYRMVGGGAD